MTAQPTTDQVRDWLGCIPETAHITDETVDTIARAWDRLRDLYPQDGDEAPDTTAADAAGMYILGDLTLAEAGQWVADARARLSRSMDALTGVMVAASLAGIPETRITEEAGVTRMTVRARTGK